MVNLDVDLSELPGIIGDIARLEKKCAELEMENKRLREEVRTPKAGLYTAKYHKTILDKFEKKVRKHFGGEYGKAISNLRSMASSETYSEFVEAGRNRTGG